ncbi:hypothetical protein ARMSODRAFT_1090142 [Armillaria solidipes]|uniref:Uncharacterized protein n=1 Tax=Armillaria solidipes TaxID=1076256 RepID=A0A2H3ASY7_9AGAR|nr:hypothetical protein ARMSODRAFT_1090142 [Armillaria solidipes]
MFNLQRPHGVHHFLRTGSTLRSFSELQNQTGSRRTVLVRNLPQGYDINNVIGTIKANPVEAIIPGDDQLTVRFLSEELARKCVKSDGGTDLGWSLVLDEEPSPKLNAYAVAAIGYSHLSRWMSLKNLPRDLREEDLRKHIVPQEAEYARFDPMEQQAHIGFLDIWQALRTRQNIFNYPYFREIGLTFEQRDKDEYLLPDWYPEEDIDQRNVKRAVLISNVANIDIARPIRGWIRDLKLSGPHHVLFNSFYPKEKLIKTVFSTSVSAREFVGKHISAAQEIGLKMSLKPQSKPLPLSTITAVDLGASPVVVLRLHRSQRCSIQEYLDAFNHTGGLKISEQFSEGLSHGLVYMTFNSVSDAMRCIVGFQKDDTLIGFEGSSMNFIGARQLVPFVKAFEGREPWKR